MTTLPQHYTPLESVLLFQALRVHGIESNAFARISSDLKSIPLVRSDASYNAERLAPEALRRLYLDLLKEEARRDLENQLSAETNGDGARNSRKRKAPSPKLPTVQEAASHTQLIPQLLARLYMRYREVTVASIREQEAIFYDAVARESGTTSEAGFATQAEIPSSSGTSEIVSTTKHVPPLKRTSQARIDDMLNRPSDPAKENASHRRSSSGNSMPSLADLAGVTSTRPTVPQHQYQTSPTQYHPAVPPSQAHALRPGSPHGSPQTQSFTPQTSASPRPVLPPPPGIAAPGMPQPHSSGIYHPQAMHGANRYVQAPGTPTQYVHGQAYQPQNVPPYGANPRGGIMLPPFQLSTPDQSRGQQANYPPQQQYASQPQQYTHGHPARTHSHGFHAAKAPATGPRLPSQIQPHELSRVIAALATPPRLSRQTVWKREKQSTPLSAPGSPKRPDVEPLSPTLARAVSPSHASARRQTTRGNRRQTSHAARSASVASTADGSEDTHTSRRRIKPEQPSTPIIRDSEEPDPVASQSSGGGIVTRKRRGTLSGHPPPSHLKRQRQASTLEQPDEPPPRSTMITAMRNFPRMSGVIMNEIVSHKHGSRFAQPVRDSHAEGYSTFIKRPQDLKSIRAAISQGSKAIAALTTESPGGTAAAAATDGGAMIELERSADLMPPKAIVNGAQLEKELMRIFANAVMFNPGEDGMVADAREMFDDVEAKIAEWRHGAESKGEDEDGEEEGNRAKRRKL